jgi:hypothetical protein
MGQNVHKVLLRLRELIERLPHVVHLYAGPRMLVLYVVMWAV